MSVKNHKISLRISEEQDNLLDLQAEALGFGKSNLARLLLNKAMKQLQRDSISAKGYENLQFTFKSDN